MCETEGKHWQRKYSEQEKERQYWQKKYFDLLDNLESFENIYCTNCQAYKRHNIETPEIEIICQDCKICNCSFCIKRRNAK